MKRPSFEVLVKVFSEPKEEKLLDTAIDEFETNTVVRVVETDTVKVSQ